MPYSAKRSRSNLMSLKCTWKILGANARMARSQSIICHTKWLGSIAMPKFGLGTRSNTRRQFAGEVMMFWPPGQLVSSKSMGQFSIATRMPSSSATFMMGFQTAPTSSRFSSSDLFVMRPIKLVTLGTPSFLAAWITLTRCSLQTRRRSRSASILLG